MFCFRAELSVLESSSQNLDEVGKDIVQKSSPKMPFMGSEKSQEILEAHLQGLVYSNYLNVPFWALPIIPEGEHNYNCCCWHLYSCNFLVVVIIFSYAPDIIFE